MKLKRHTSYNDGRAIAIMETDPRKQNAILDYCESTAIASASHDSIVKFVFTKCLLERRIRWWINEH
ncbi:hypothetical protein T12_9724 [Trichinella patagoniensis]|uniref:Uncharacterized protein n=1 Tax=Trichinella patagoniensis TaxID=990121 RepID=A0A0V0ZZL2_9BILA|nr:hypothetical protein T12_9724 [Trichinella patagoniensis]